jgi:Protein of unknown function (DUF2924)
MSLAKLTDTQLVTLSAASQREDRGIVLPPNLKGGAAQKFVAKLVELGLVEEIRASGDLPVWRREDDNRPMALRITKHGLKAIAVEDDPGDQHGSEDKPAALEGATMAVFADAKPGRAAARSDRDAGKDSIAAAPGGQTRSKQVLDEHFAWNGTTYRSLTEVAVAMTGTRWSGPRFFGLRDHRRSA